MEPEEILNTPAESAQKKTGSANSKAIIAGVVAVLGVAIAGVGVWWFIDNNSEETKTFEEVFSDVESVSTSLTTVENSVDSSQSLTQFEDTFNTIFANETVDVSEEPGVIETEENLPEDFDAAIAEFKALSANLDELDMDDVPEEYVDEVTFLQENLDDFIIEFESLEYLYDYFVDLDAIFASYDDEFAALEVEGAPFDADETLDISDMEAYVEQYSTLFDALIADMEAYQPDPAAAEFHAAFTVAMDKVFTSVTNYLDEVVAFANDGEAIDFNDPAAVEAYLAQSEALVAGAEDFEAEVEASFEELPTPFLGKFTDEELIRLEESLAALEDAI